MKYLCLIYVEADTSAAMTQRDFDSWTNRQLDHDEELRRSGHFVTAQALQPPQAAATVRVRDGRLSVTDGPFAETKEQLGGFILIEARDLNEAIAVAGRIPMAEIGSIEVRPIMELTKR